ncbi:MAG: hypothetical protein PWP08_1833 [Methanofollis sp.]|nr:hypothetical protein [Methanofollis sp.]
MYTFAPRPARDNIPPDAPMIMEDTTFSALAGRARAYPVVQRRSQMSKNALRARQEAASAGRKTAPLPCEICT